MSSKVEVDQPTKKPWISKTIITSIVIAIIGWIPGGQEWIASHPGLSATIVSVIMFVLRWITKDKIVIG